MAKNGAASPSVLAWKIFPQFEKRSLAFPKCDYSPELSGECRFGMVAEQIYSTLFGIRYIQPQMFNSEDLSESKVGHAVLNGGGIFASRKSDLRQIAFPASQTSLRVLRASFAAIQPRCRTPISMLLMEFCIKH